MYIPENKTQEPEFIQRYKINPSRRGLEPRPLRDLHKYDVNRTLGQTLPTLPPWVLWLAIGLLIWLLVKK